MLSLEGPNGLVGLTWQDIFVKDTWSHFQVSNPQGDSFFYKIYCREDRFDPIQLVAFIYFATGELDNSEVAPKRHYAYMGILKANSVFLDWTIHHSEKSQVSTTAQVARVASWAMKTIFQKEDIPKGYTILPTPEELNVANVNERSWNS